VPSYQSKAISAFIFDMLRFNCLVVCANIMQALLLVRSDRLFHNNLVEIKCLMRDAPDAQCVIYVARVL
jgi:hypothetical protein